MSLLKTMREDRMLTQDALAAQSGVSVWTISRIENGTVEPELRTIRALAEALKVEPQVLRNIGRPATNGGPQPVTEEASG